MEKYYDALKKYDGSLFWVAEEYFEKEGFHIHALIAVPKRDKVLDVQGFQYFKNLWNNLTLGLLGNKALRIDVQRYDSSKAASLYVTKNIGSEKVDYDYHGKLTI